ncbi:LysM peptidoglycan-binding domain-containing protein [Ascidiimonas sp. W6]|uniref:CIS tube protein n=1 Tax=Ascidiimonas meishanensis TaxID=3128903 RepID=UPI0030EB37AB
MAFNFLKFEKLTIVSYEKAERTGKGEKFVAMFNPESYSLSYQNVYDTKQGINTSGRTARYAMSKPEKLNLKIILDGSGVSTFGLTNIIGRGHDDVYKQVQRFLEITSDMDGKIHEPRYLTLKWGDLLFKCRLGSVSINYSLFNSSGIPLRAELDTQFFGDLEKSERLKKERKSSPDLTHYRVAGAHDQLPLMCEKIYGAAQYYVFVAKANHLNDFRNLKPGQEIYFPPIEK